MAWPATAVTTGDTITATQLNGLSVRIADAVVQEPATEIAFWNIPQHYAHLRLVTYFRVDDPTAAVRAVNVRFNLDPQELYWSQWYGAWSSGSQSAGGYQDQTEAQFASAITGAGAAESWTAAELTIPSYASSSRRKCGISRYGEMWDDDDLSALGSVNFAIYYLSNDPITEIQLFPAAGLFSVDCRAELYGLA